MIPERLKSLRKEANISQKKLAAALKTSQQNIAYWENGDRTPKYDSLAKIADYFETSIDYLLGNTDIKNSAELSDTDLLNIINTGSASYDGKPLNKHDEETLKQVLKDYFDGKLKDYN